MSDRLPAHFQRGFETDLHTQLRHATRLVAHNAKFDLRFLAVWRGEHAPLGARMDDTQLMSYLLDERPVRSMYKAHGLKDLARTRYDVPDYHFEFPPFWALMDSDRPYVLETGAGEIVELPVHWALDDWEQYAYIPDPPFRSAIESPQKVLDLWISELDAMRRHDCLFVLTCHPFLSGRPHRVEVLRTLIEHALAAGDVDFMACRDVAALDWTDRRVLTPVEVDPGIYPDRA